MLLQALADRGHHCAAVTRKAAALVTVSRYMRDYIKRWGNPDARALYFPPYGTQLPPCHASFERVSGDSRGRGGIRL